MAAKKLARAKRALKAFVDLRQETLSHAETLLADFNKSGLIKSFHKYREKNLAKAKKALQIFTDNKLGHFDIFRKAGFSADEDPLSDAIAALLDPKESHQLGTLPLKKFLESICYKAPARIKGIISHHHQIHQVPEIL